MSEYESPTVTELGSVEAFTMGQTVFGIDFDGLIFWLKNHYGEGGS